MPAKRPMPWYSCTTRSPTERSAQLPSRSRLDTAFFFFLLRAETAAIWVSVRMASPASGKSSPALNEPSATVHRPGGGSSPPGKPRRQFTPRWANIPASTSIRCLSEERSTTR